MKQFSWTGPTVNIRTSSIYLVRLPAVGPPPSSASAVGRETSRGSSPPGCRSAIATAVNPSATGTLFLPFAVSSRNPNTSTRREQRADERGLPGRRLVQPRLAGIRARLPLALLGGRRAASAPPRLDRAGRRSPVLAAALALRLGHGYTELSASAAVLEGVLDRRPPAHRDFVGEALESRSRRQSDELRLLDRRPRGDRLDDRAQRRRAVVLDVGRDLRAVAVREPNADRADRLEARRDRPRGSPPRSPSRPRASRAAASSTLNAISGAPGRRPARRRRSGAAAAARSRDEALQHRSAPQAPQPRPRAAAARVRPPPSSP